MKSLSSIVVFLAVCITVISFTGCKANNASSIGLSDSSSQTSEIPLDLSTGDDKATDLKVLLGNDYQAFLDKAIISERIFSHPKKEITAIENVSTFGDSFVVVKFDSFIECFNSKDITLQSRNSNWYSLKDNIENGKVQIDSFGVGNAPNGNTVVVYKLKNNIRWVGLYDSGQKTVSQSEKAKLILQADNVLTWQIPSNGGWDKDYDNHIKVARKEGESYITNGATKNGVPLGTIDNNATYSEMRLVAEAYAQSGEARFKESFELAVEFLKSMQYPRGGFPQMYPKRGNYSDYVTLNDDAMVNVLILLEDIVNNKYPFIEIINDTKRQEIKAMFDKGIEFLIKSQIKLENGQMAGWCAQHDPVSYKPLAARAFEPVSLSGKESVKAIKLLLSQRDNDDAVKAGEGALEWLDSIKVENTGFDNVSGKLDSETGEINYFYYQEGSTIWYRFYEINTGKGIFGDRDGLVYYDIKNISEERRIGYSWAGNYGAGLYEKYTELGYFPGRIVVKIIGSNSQTEGSMSINSQKEADKNLS